MGLWCEGWMSSSVFYRPRTCYVLHELTLLKALKEKKNGPDVNFDWLIYPFSCQIVPRRMQFRSLFPLYVHVAIYHQRQ